MNIKMTIYEGNNTINVTDYTPTVTLTVVENLYQSSIGGAVNSVNGKTGTVVLGANDINESSNRFWLTDVLKTAYDSAVTWISTNGSNLINHLSNTSNPHNTTASQVGTYTTSQVDTALGLKANVTEVETILFKTITSTVVTGKTVETCIYSIPLPTDGLNYIIEVSSRAQISTMSGSTISHRLRVGTYLSPIDGASGADAIGNQTLLGFKSESTGVGFPVTRRFKYFGGSTGSIFGMQASISINDDNVSNSTSMTLKSADLTTQHYLYVSFNPSVITAIVTHLMLTIKVIKI